VSIRRLLRKWVVDGGLSVIGKPLYESTIAIELAIQRAIDAFQADGEMQDQIFLDNHLTAVIKTFERPKALRRLLTSIKRSYPGLRIVVVDDSRCPVQLDEAKTIIMPYDSGVSAGRHEGLKHVTTKYVLILDDDFIIDRNAGFESAIAIMEAHPEIDIMGGKVIYLPFYSARDYSKGSLWPTEAKPTMPAGSQIGGLPVYNKVANFYIGQTERVRLVDWDPALKRIDHADFFTRAMGVLTTVFNPSLKCLHAQTPFDKVYMKKRKDFMADRLLLISRYYPSTHAASEGERKNGERDK